MGRRFVGKRVTLVDVARRTGLSPATVSSVLNDRPNSRIAEHTAQRVRLIAAQLGYTPDPTARGLRTGKTGAIGFISDEVTVTRYASAMIRGLLDVGDARQHVVVMAECDNQWDRVERAIEVLRSRRVDGLVFGLMRARRIELPRLPRELPAIVVNGTASGLRAVLPDEHLAGRAAVEHLVDQGHRRIAFIGRSATHLDPAVSVTIGRRVAGIDEAMAAAGLAFEHEVGGRYWEPELGFDGAMEIFDRAPGVTALLAANDRVALGIYQAAQVRGLVIPGQLSVMSFDDEQLATYLRPQVTTMRLPYLELGSAAMSLMTDSLASGADLEGDESELLVPMPLMERGSVRRV